jgi:DNA-binding transcriptional ArsR family regulator
LVLGKRLVLIDTPDYSKTDRRLMTKDLEEIYWLWEWASQTARSDVQAGPNIVVAIQKEMSRGHFFFDKMDKVELEPLRPEEMVEAYRKRFKAVEPFTEDALLSLARMSRGIFRRFLRYITLTLRHWEGYGKGVPIDAAFVREAVPVARLAEDMELELAELFPKQSDLRLLAVRLLMLLEESGGRNQSELADLLGVEAYVLSRLLTKLETAHYVTRRREGNDKTVALYHQEPRDQITPAGGLLG